MLPRVALVTGGTDGIGKEIARGLASAGLRVLVVGRDRDKGARSVRELRESTGNDDVSFIAADLELVSEAERLAAEIGRLTPALHLLVHSAGIVRGRRVLTDEGVESNFAVNYLSRFVLTTRLLPLMTATGRADLTARILIVGGAALNGTLHFDDLDLTRGFSTIRAVRQFCQANDVLTVELARRLGAAPRVTITSLKVGVVKTNIRHEFPTWMKVLVPLVFDPLLGQTPAEAARAGLELLLEPRHEGTTGALFTKIRAMRRVEPKIDRDLGRALWSSSEALVARASRSWAERVTSGRAARSLEGGNMSTTSIGRAHSNGKSLRITHWVSTGIFAMMFTVSGARFIMGTPDVVAGMQHLGYPDYFARLLGIAKLLGVAALLVPLPVRALREWAYAGFAFTCISATASHAMSGDPAAKIAPPVIALVVLMTSYFSRRR